MISWSHSCHPLPLCPDPEGPAGISPGLLLAPGGGSSQLSRPLRPSVQGGAEAMDRDPVPTPTSPGTVLPHRLSQIEPRASFGEEEARSSETPAPRGASLRAGPLIPQAKSPWAQEEKPRALVAAGEGEADPGQPVPCPTSETLPRPCSPCRPWLSRPREPPAPLQPAVPWGPRLTCFTRVPVRLTWVCSPGRCQHCHQGLGGPRAQ